MAEQKKEMRGWAKYATDYLKAATPQGITYDIATTGKPTTTLDFLQSIFYKKDTSQLAQPELADGILPDYNIDVTQEAEDMAKLYSELKLQGLMSEYQNLETMAATSNLGLEEMQGKYGISGGLALAQADELQRNQMLLKSGIDSQMANLGLEEQLLTEDLKQSMYQNELSKLLGQQQIQSGQISNIGSKIDLFDILSRLEQSGVDLSAIL